MSDIKSPTVNSKSDAIQSFTATELTTGKSQLVFYLTPSKDSTATRYTLSTELVPCAPTAQGYQGASGGSWTQVFDRDFDITITKPIQIQGDAYFTWVYGTDHGAAETGNMRLTVTINHYDGATETAVVTKTSNDDVFTLDDDLKYKTLRIPIPKYRWTIGEIFRVSVKLEFKSAGTGAGCDPFMFFDNTNIGKYDTSDTTAYPGGIGPGNMIPDDGTCKIIIPYNPKD